VGGPIRGERALEFALFLLLVAAIEELARALSVLRILGPRHRATGAEHCDEEAKSRDP